MSLDLLAGQTAIVTGAASGIGLAVALRLADEGCRVAVADLDTSAGERAASLIRANGKESFFIRTDVAEEHSAETAVAEASDRLGNPSILVNVAGVAFSGRVTDTSEENWDRVLDTNLKGTFLMCKHVLPRFVSLGRGAITNVASNAGLVGVRNLAAYCASKGGVIQLTRALALEWADKNIRVNAVAPTSTIRTRMFETRLRNAPDPGALERAVARANPMGRLGTPEDIAEFVVFLSSDRAGYVTGGIFPIDGGLTAASSLVRLPT